jgi:hypothetical protein
MAGNPDPWPPSDLADALDQPSPHAQWPPPDLDDALTLPGGVTQLDRAPTAAEAAAYRPRYSAAAAQAYRDDGSP